LPQTNDNAAEINTTAGDAVPHASIGTRSVDVAGGSAEDELPDASVGIAAESAGTLALSGEGNVSAVIQKSLLDGDRSAWPKWLQKHIESLEESPGPVGFPEVTEKLVRLDKLLGHPVGQVCYMCLSSGPLIHTYPAGEGYDVVYDGSPPSSWPMDQWRSQNHSDH